MGKTSQIPVKIFQTNQSAFQSDGLILYCNPWSWICWVPKKSTHIRHIPCTQFWWMFHFTETTIQDHPGIPWCPPYFPRWKPTACYRRYSASSSAAPAWNVSSPPVAPAMMKPWWLSHPFEGGEKYNCYIWIHMAISFWPVKQGIMVNINTWLVHTYVTYVLCSGLNDQTLGLQEQIRRKRIGECSWVVPWSCHSWDPNMEPSIPSWEDQAAWFTLWIGGPLRSLSGKTHEVSCFYGDLEVLVLWFYDVLW